MILNISHAEKDFFPQNFSQNIHDKNEKFTYLEKFSILSFDRPVVKSIE